MKRVIQLLALICGAFACLQAAPLHDMLGNVSEWVQDCWNDTYKGAPSDGSAWTSGDCGHRMTRGGSWANTLPELRVASRSWTPPGNRHNNLGFRLARAL